MAQFAYNNAVHATTGETPFFANYGYNPVLIGEPRNKEAVSEEAEEVIDTIDYIRTQLSRDIEFMNLRMAICYAETSKRKDQVKNWITRKSGPSQSKKNWDQSITNYDCRRACQKFIQYFISRYWNQPRKTQKSLKMWKSMMTQNRNMRLNKS
jgi:hypothetical protein